MAVLSREKLAEIRAAASNPEVVYLTKRTARDLLDTIDAQAKEVNAAFRMGKDAALGELALKRGKGRAKHTKQERRDAHGRMLTGTLERALKRLQRLRHPWPPEVTSVVNEIEGALKP